MVTYFLNDEMPMNEPIDENEPAFVSASGTSHVYPTWEVKEVADAIDRIRRKRLPPGTILEGLDRLPVMTSIHGKVLSTEKYPNQYRLVIALVPSEFPGAVRKAEVQEKSLLRLLWYFLTKSWLTLDFRKDPGFMTGEASPLRRTD